MGYDISGPDGIELHLPADAFSQLAAHGYFWFVLIDAVEMDGAGCSGIGESKAIRVGFLEDAIEELEYAAPGERPLPPGIENGGSVFEMANRDPFAFWKAPLVRFMKACIDWCKKNGAEGIEIEFA